MGDRTQTTVRLPYGRYDAILFNRSFDEFGTMAFRGQEQLHTLEAYALQTETRYGTKIITAAPGKLASAVIHDFEVTDNMLGNYAPAGARSVADCPDGACRLQFTPLPLTRKVKVKLHITGIDNLKQATCQLSGVPLSVYLHDGNTDNAEKGAQEFEIEDITPDEDFAANGTLNGLIHLFGLPAPEEVQIKSLAERQYHRCRARSGKHRSERRGGRQRRHHPAHKGRHHRTPARHKALGRFRIRRRRRGMGTREQYGNPDLTNMDYQSDDTIYQSKNNIQL